MFSGFLGGPLIDNDPDVERDPPKDPTPITFPVYEASKENQWPDRTTPPDLRGLFSRITKPTDISHRHREALNIETFEACRIDDLLPATDGASYLPPLTGSVTPNTTSPSTAKNGGANTSSEWNDYEQRLSELVIDNDFAFRSLTKRLPNGTNPHRLLHSRKFWVGLESMSSYWDCDLDEVFEAHDTSASTEQKCTKRVRPNSATPDSLWQNLPCPPSTEQEHTLHNTSISDGDPTPTTPPPSASPEANSKLRYRGRRIGTGRDMPDQFRVDTVRGFVECAIFGFQCALAPPRRMPIVQLQGLNLPVRQTAAVYRMSQDRAKARHACYEGPVVGLQVRSETDFSAPESGPDVLKSRLDLMREFGGLLQLAQERRREGKTEVKPGEGMWYTTKPRWGGGSGGATKNGINTDVHAIAEESLDGARDRRAKDNRSRPRRTPAMLWKELRCGSGIWDDRTEYRAIGKSPSSPYDEVFMLTSLNTHVAILKLTIHTAYTDHLISGLLPALPRRKPTGAGRASSARSGSTCSTRRSALAPFAPYGASWRI